MLSENELAVLSCFFPDPRDRTAKDLESAADLSHEPAFRTLKQLAAKGLLKEKKYGKTNVYEYVWREESLLALCYANTKRLLALKAKKPELLAQARDIAKQAHARMTLFLPAVEKKEVVIICVSAMHDLDTITALLKTKYNTSLPVLGKSREEMERLRDDDPPCYERIIKEAIIIDGIEYFCKEVYGHGVY